MLGMLFLLRRWDGQGFPVDERVFLRSRRRGPQGEKMRKLVREYRRCAMNQAASATRVAALMQQAVTGALEEAQLEKLDRAQAEAAGAARESSERALELAEEIVALALAENYGEGAEDILDKFNDAELHAAVSTIEMGAMPRDFFQYRVTPPSGSFTNESGSEQGAPFSPPDTPAQS